MTITPLVQQVALAYDWPADLLAAQVQQESSGDPFAFRYESAYYAHYVRGKTVSTPAQYGPLAACSFGLLQIMLETACEIGFTDRPELLFVDRVGLTWGVKYLKQLQAQCGGDVAKTLAAYNGGLGAVATTPWRTQSYVDAVYQKAGRTT